MGSSSSKPQPTKDNEISLSSFEKQLIEFIKNGKVQKFKALFEENYLDNNLEIIEPNSKELVPLWFYAARWGQLDIIVYLIEKGANFDTLQEHVKQKITLTNKECTAIRNLYIRLISMICKSIYNVSGVQSLDNCRNFFISANRISQILPLISKLQSLPLNMLLGQLLGEVIFYYNFEFSKVASKFNKENKEKGVLVYFSEELKKLIRKPKSSDEHSLDNIKRDFGYHMCLYRFLCILANKNQEFRSNRSSLDRNKEINKYPEPLQPIIKNLVVAERKISKSKLQDLWKQLILSNVVQPNSDMTILCPLLVHIGQLNLVKHIINDRVQFLSNDKVEQKSDLREYLLILENRHRKKFPWYEWIHQAVIKPIDLSCLSESQSFKETFYETLASELQKHPFFKTHRIESFDEKLDQDGFFLSMRLNANIKKLLKELKPSEIENLFKENVTTEDSLVQFINKLVTYTMATWKNEPKPVKKQTTKTTKHEEEKPRETIELNNSNKKGIRTRDILIETNNNHSAPTFPVKALDSLLKAAENFEMTKIIENAIKQKKGNIAFIIDYVYSQENPMLRNLTHAGGSLSTVWKGIKCINFLGTLKEGKNLLVSTLFRREYNLNLDGFVKGDLKNALQAQSELNEFKASFTDENGVLDYHSLLFVLLKDKEFKLFLSKNKDKLARLISALGISGIDHESVVDLITTIERLHDELQPYYQKANTFSELTMAYFADIIDNASMDIILSSSQFTKLLEHIKKLDKTIKILLEPYVKSNQELIGLEVLHQFQRCQQEKNNKKSKFWYKEKNTVRRINANRLFQCYKSEFLGVLETEKSARIRKGDCFDLQFTNKNNLFPLSKLYVERFNFHHSSFIDADFSQSKFIDCHFNGCQFVGSVNLNHLTINSKTASSLLPALSEAHKNGIQLKGQMLLESGDYADIKGCRLDKRFFKLSHKVTAKAFKTLNNISENRNTNSFEEPVEDKEETEKNFSFTSLLRNPIPGLATETLKIFKEAQRSSAYAMSSMAKWYREKEKQEKEYEAQKKAASWIEESRADLIQELQKLKKKLKDMGEKQEEERVNSKEATLYLKRYIEKVEKEINVLGFTQKLIKEHFAIDNKQMQNKKALLEGQYGEKAKLYYELLFTFLSASFQSLMLSRHGRFTESKTGEILKIESNNNGISSVSAKAASAGQFTANVLKYEPIAGGVLSTVSNKLNIATQLCANITKLQSRNPIPCVKEIGAILHGTVNHTVTCKERHTLERIHKELLENRGITSIDRLASHLALAVTLRYLNQINLLKLNAKTMKLAAESAVTRILFALFNGTITGSSEKEFIRSTLHSLRVLSCDLNSKELPFFKQRIEWIQIFSPKLKLMTDSGQKITDDDFFLKPGFKCYKNNKAVYFSNDIEPGGRPYKDGPKTDARHLGYMNIEKLPEECQMTEDKHSLGALPSLNNHSNEQETYTSSWFLKGKKETKEETNPWVKEQLLTLREEVQHLTNLYGHFFKVRPMSGIITYSDNRAPFSPPHYKNLSITHSLECLYEDFCKIKYQLSIIKTQKVKELSKTWVFPNGMDASKQLKECMKMTKVMNAKLLGIKNKYRSEEKMLSLACENMTIFEKNINSIMESSRKKKNSTNRSMKR